MHASWSLSEMRNWKNIENCTFYWQLNVQQNECHAVFQVIVIISYLKLKNCAFVVFAIGASAITSSSP